MTLGTIIDSQESLNKLASMDLPVKISYKISKIIGKMQPDLRIYEEKRVKLLKEYATLTDPEKDTWTIKKDDMDKWKSEMQILHDLEINLSFGDGKDLEPISINELDNITIKANDLVSLGWLFTN